jgi:hypothetical protein
MIFEYEQEAVNRATWYSTQQCSDNIDDMYDMWLNYIAERKELSGSTPYYEEIERIENSDTNLDEIAIMNGMDKEADLQNKEEDEDDWGF